jgi:hypothetical protein
MLSFKFFAKILVVSIVIAASFSACSKNPVGGLGEAEIPDVEGFLLKKNGVDIVEYDQHGIMRGEAIAVIGEEATYEIEFLDAEGDVIELDKDNYDILFAEYNKEYFNLELHENLGKNKFCILGNIEGQSDFSVKLMNGSLVLPEYETPRIPVKITR